MAIRMETIRLQAPATNTTQDYTFSGMGATQAVIAWAAVAGDGSDLDNVQHSCSFWDGTTIIGSAMSMETGVANASANATTRNIKSTDLIEIPAATSTTVVRSASVSTTTDGVTLTWAGTTSVRPWVIINLFNGLNGAVVGSLTPSGSDLGTVTESGLGITPRVIFGISNGLNAIDSTKSTASLSFGYAVDNGTDYDNTCTVASMDNNSATQNGRIRTYTDTDSQGDFGMFAGLSGSSPIMSGEVTNMASGEFEITTNDTDAQNGNLNTDLYYLALDFDGECEMFVSAIPTTAVDWVPLTGASFTPESMIAISTFDIELNNTRSTDPGLAFQGLYAATATSEHQIAWCGEHGTATNSNSSSRTETHIFMQDHAAGAPDAVFENPVFGAGSITFGSGETLFSEGSTVSRVTGLAFGAGSSAIPVLHHARTLYRTI
jgi:hypothetical protein